MTGYLIIAPIEALTARNLQLCIHFTCLQTSMSSTFSAMSIQRSRESYTGKLNFFPCSTLRRLVSPVRPHAPRPKKHSLGVINPEEVGVQHRLHQPRHPSYLIHVSLREVPVEPVGNVYRPIEAQREDIVRCYRLRFTGSLKHK